MPYASLLVETIGAVCLIRLNRPEALHALNGAMMAELVAALQAADGDAAVRCIVLTGGGKAFAAGADIKEMAGKSFAEAFIDNLFAAETTAIQSVRKPVIAAVQGYCLGGGCELAMMCDFILAADDAKFGQPEINLGIVAGMGGTQRLTRLIGRSKSMDMHLTGRFMAADEAERAGLASRIFPAARLIEEAMAIAQKIAEKSRLSTMMVKEAVHAADQTTLAQGLLLERRLFHAAFATQDQKEGMAAFLDKRAPRFDDR